MKNWKENRALACVVLAAAILGGTFGIGGAKLSSAARSVNEAYAQNIAGDLALRAAAAQNIIAEGEAALGADAASVKTAKRAVEALEAAEGPAQEYAANAALTASVGMLYEETRKVSGDDKGSVLQTQWSEFLSRGNIIDNSADAYNEQARAAQKKLSGFPASLIAHRRKNFPPECGPTLKRSIHEENPTISARYGAAGRAVAAGFGHGICRVGSGPNI